MKKITKERFKEIVEETFNDTRCCGVDLYISAYTGKEYADIYFFFPDSYTFTITIPFSSTPRVFAKHAMSYVDFFNSSLEALKWRDYYRQHDRTLHRTIDEMERDLNSAIDFFAELLILIDGKVEMEFFNAK